MPLLVDTWNVLHQTGVLPPDLAGVGLKGLGQLIQRSRWGSAGVVLVCDGTPSGPHMGLPVGIRAVFSGHDREADEVIEGYIAASSAPRRLTVVSSDRRIRTAARKRSCSVLTAELFLERLVYDAEGRRKPQPTRPHKVDLPTDMIAEAQAMLDQVQGLPTRRRAPKRPPADQPAAPKRADLDGGPLPQSIIDAARRLLEEG